MFEHYWNGVFLSFCVTSLCYVPMFLVPCSLFRSCVPYGCTLCVGSLFIHWLSLFGCLIWFYFRIPRNISRYSSVSQIPVSYPIPVKYDMIHLDNYDTTSRKLTICTLRHVEPVSVRTSFPPINRLRKWQGNTSQRTMTVGLYHPTHSTNYQVWSECSNHRCFTGNGGNSWKKNHFLNKITFHEQCG